MPELTGSHLRPSSPLRQRSPVLLKSLLYHFDYAAFKTGALVVPTCDVLTLSMCVLVVPAEGAVGLQR